MPWKERSVVEERMQFVLRLEQGERMTDLCREFSISRKTGYKIYSRYKENGAGGLWDESRRPLNHPNKTPDEIEELIVKARERKPTWGSKKLRADLKAKHPGVRIPARCTIDEILKRNGLVIERRRRRQVPAYPEKLARSQAANDIWCADFKGQFRLGNGKLCYPLTITDHFSRYLLACVALEGPTREAAFAVFDDAFSRYGLPRVIRTDNGTPFASRGLAGLSALSAWWLSMGIVPERIEKGHPEQNGRHERMHRTLKEEATRPASLTILAQQERFDAYIEEFNTERPHEALGMKKPAELFIPSSKAYPTQLQSINYPLHDRQCRVSTSGVIYVGGFKFKRDKFFLSESFAGHNVGLRELEDGRWLVSFAQVDVGHVDRDGANFIPMDEIRLPQCPPQEAQETAVDGQPKGHGNG